jgi:hypothetical protein
MPLREEAFAEAQIDDTDAEPGCEACGSTHAREPREDHSGARVNCHIGKEGERSTRGYCDIRKSGPRGTEEYLGGIAGDGEAICKQIDLNTTRRSS